MVSYHSYTAASTATMVVTGDCASYTTAGTLDVSGSNVTVYCVPPPRRIITAPPAHWTKEDIKAWVELINKRTKTGWTISMVIFGDVLITDPNIETRSHEAMVELLKWRASPDDCALIDAFMAERSE